nr:class I SAM-dependent methyltransferase [Rhabdothermincola salaria]
MEDRDQARAYSEGDFAAAHEAIVDDVVRRHPELGRGAGLEVVDLGCGPADVTVRLARRLPEASVLGLDAGPVMLGLARARIDALGLAVRVTVAEARLPDVDEDLSGRFGLVVSNSVLHHLDDPGALWSSVKVLGAPGGAVHVADLCRPGDGATLDDLVARHATGEPDVLVEDFRNSLAAAYRPDEVRDQLVTAGLDALRVDVISDRHLVVWGRLP